MKPNTIQTSNINPPNQDTIPDHNNTEKEVESSQNTQENKIESLQPPDITQLKIENKDAQKLQARRTMDEDLNPTGSYTTKGRLVSFDDRSITIALDPKDKQEFDLNICKALEKDPTTLLKKLPDTNLLPLQSLDLKINALRDIDENLDLNIKDEHKRIEDSKGNVKEDPELLSHFFEKQDEIQKALKKFENKNEEAKAECKRLLKTYYKTCYTVLKDKNLTLLNECNKKFIKLQTLDPKSLAPFYPWLSILSYSIDKKSLTLMIKRASQIDPYLTYAFMMHFICMLYAEKKSNHYVKNCNSILCTCWRSYKKSILTISSSLCTLRQ